MCDIKEDIRTWVEDFLKKRSISKYELEIAGKSSKGDGYLGDVIFVKVLTEMGGENEKIYNLVIKSPKKGVEFRKKIPLKEIFEREIFMYSKVFPAFRTFQLEKRMKTPFMQFPKCYGLFNENQREAIMLQNLMCLGYEIHDRRTPQNLEHLLLVFQYCAKFHALSLSLKRQKPDLYKDLTHNMTDLLYKFMVEVNMIPFLANDFRAELELLKDKDDATYKKLAHIDESFIKSTLFKVKDSGDGLCVVLHGDFWNSNVMFAYKDETRSQPSDMMFLDFQLSSVGSPIYDLSYYLYAVADDNVLNNFDLLLQTYHHSLIGFLKELGEHSYDISLEDIIRHWIEYGKLGLVLAPFNVKVQLSETDEVVDMAESAKNGTIVGAFTTVTIKNKDAYHKRIESVFKHYASLL